MVRSKCPMCKRNFESVMRSDGLNQSVIPVRSTEGKEWEEEEESSRRRSSRLKRKRDKREDIMRGYSNGRIRSIVNRLEASSHLEKRAKWSASIASKKKKKNKKNSLADTEDTKGRSKNTMTSCVTTTTTTQLLTENELLRRKLEKLKRKKKKKKKKTPGRSKHNSHVDFK
jgi:hypothetical protein